jgi:hypothetical protein
MAFIAQTGLKNTSLFGLAVSPLLSVKTVNNWIVIYRNIIKTQSYFFSYFLLMFFFILFFLPFLAKRILVIWSSTVK